MLDPVWADVYCIRVTSCSLPQELILYPVPRPPTFCPHLEVCFFVNSGSEANDLALRLARTHTGQRYAVLQSDCRWRLI